MPFANAQQRADCAHPFASATGHASAAGGQHARAYRRIKHLKGERFARALRDHHSGLLEIPNLEHILRHAGNEAVPLLPYLMTLLDTNDNDSQPVVPQDPFELLKQAGYTAFYADTLEAQNSIKRYFKAGELLCTFNDAARHKQYHIIHAVKNNADQLNRADFKGKEDRQDAYGTSVISIQILKSGGFIKITNRYNHAVNHSDNTFNSNPDNIVKGLSAALKNHFDVDFTASKSPLPEGYTLVGNQIVQYHTESNNIFYGDQVFVQGGTVHAVDRSAGNALFDRFMFDNKTKTLHKINPASKDSFAEDFNHCYGGNAGLRVDSQGNLCLNDTILIGAKNSRITTLYLPALTQMGNNCLYNAPALTQFDAPALTQMGRECLYIAPALTQFNAPALTQMGNFCLSYVPDLTQFDTPALMQMGAKCLKVAPAQTRRKAEMVVRENMIHKTFRTTLLNAAKKVAMILRV